MIQKQAFRYRAYPTPSQQTFLKRTIHDCWWFYRYVLHHYEDDYRNAKTAYQNEILSYYNGAMAYHPYWLQIPITKPKIPKEYYPLGAPIRHHGKGNLSTYKLLQKVRIERQNMKDIPAVVLQEVLERVAHAFDRFWKSGFGYPNYPKERNYHSITWTDTATGHLYEPTGLLKLSMLPGLLKIKYHRHIMGEIKRVTVSFDNLGKWYVSIICEYRTEPTCNPPKRIVGVDIGIRKSEDESERQYATLSDGEKVWFARMISGQSERKEEHQQRKLSMLQRGTTEWRKQLRKINHAREHKANRTNNFIHNLTRRLERNFDYVVIEDIDLRDMKTRRKNPVGISDTDLCNDRKRRKGFTETAHGQFKRQLEYKLGNRLIKVPPYNTSKQCNICGKINTSVDMSVKYWECPHCQSFHDRDINAAINIMNRGLPFINDLIKQQEEK